MKGHKPGVVFQTENYKEVLHLPFFSFTSLFLLLAIGFFLFSSFLLLTISKENMNNKGCKRL